MFVRTPWLASTLPWLHLVSLPASETSEGFGRSSAHCGEVLSRILWSLRRAASASEAFSSLDCCFK
jgi:hypothetical protein